MTPKLYMLEYSPPTTLVTSSLYDVNGYFYCGAIHTEIFFYSTGFVLRVRTGSVHFSIKEIFDLE